MLIICTTDTFFVKELEWKEEERTKKENEIEYEVWKKLGKREGGSHGRKKNTGVKASQMITK